MREGRRPRHPQTQDNTRVTYDPKRKRFGYETIDNLVVVPHTPAKQKNVPSTRRWRLKRWQQSLLRNATSIHATR